jgi:hypothetical protein
MLQEYIRAGQRVERFHIDSWNGTQWTPVAQGTTIGHKRLLRFPPVTAGKFRLVIDQSRTSPALASFGVYKAPPRVTVDPNGGGFEDSVTVRLSSDVAGVTVYYTLDGTTPTLESARYVSPVVLTRSTTVTALPAVDGEPGIEASRARFIRCRRVQGITFGKRYSPKYQGHGDATVTDGHRASAGFDDGKWLGFEADDMTATLDLGETQPIRNITAGFLQQQGSWVFLPSRVSCSASVDGTTWKALPEVTYPVKQTAEVLVKDCTFPAGEIKARYVRVVARNVGTCPPWHDGAGNKAWLFVDEIVIE